MNKVRNLHYNYNTYWLFDYKETLDDNLLHKHKCSKKKQSRNIMTIMHLKKIIKKLYYNISHKPAIISSRTYSDSKLIHKSGKKNQLQLEF